MAIFKKMAVMALLAAPAMASADIYLTVGGASGSVDMSHIEASYGAGAATETDDDVKRAVIGLGADVSRYLGFEASYMTNSDNRVSDATDVDSFDHQGIQLAVIGRLPIGQQFDLFGKLSANYMSTEYTYSISGVELYKEETTGAHLGAGIGARIRFNDSVALLLSAERIMMSEVIDEGFLGESGDVDVDQAKLAVEFHF